MKKCTKCSMLLPLTDFYTRPERKSGCVKAKCKSCICEEAKNKRKIERASIVIPLTKVCVKCNLDKPLTDYYKHSHGRFGVQPRCKTCCLEAFAVYRKEHPEIFKERVKAAKAKKPEKYRALSCERQRIFRKTGKNYIAALKRCYGITYEEYQTILAEQNNCCAICKKTTEQTGKKLHVDHNHKINKVRGILCGKCNRAIGLFDDNPALLFQAIDYLNRYSNVPEIQ